MGKFNMTTFVQWLLIVWFVLVNCLVIVPSIQLLRGVADQGAPPIQAPQPPTPPSPPVLAPINPGLPPDVQKNQVAYCEQQVKAYTEQTNVYAQQVSAYTKQLDVYKAYSDAAGKPGGLAVYQAVANETLLKLMEAVIAGLLAFAFAKAGARALKDRALVKAGEKPDKTALF